MQRGRGSCRKLPETLKQQQQCIDVISLHAFCISHFIRLLNEIPIVEAPPPERSRGRRAHERRVKGISCGSSAQTRHNNAMQIWPHYV